MSSWRECIIHSGASIMEAVKAIDNGGMQIALIVDDDDRLLGILTDGDIRRAVIRGVDFSTEIENIMKVNPSVATVGQSNDEIRELMRARQVHQIPIVDANGRVERVVSFVDVIGKRKYDNIVVLMVGGLGTRLMPLTKNYPKPLLRIGAKPILEIILESFVEKGFYQFYFSVNYKSEMIESYFKDGSDWGVEIHYIKEERRMGTAGALGLLREIPKQPVIVMNGDILTKVDFSSLINYHLSEGADATMAVREYNIRIPYGVIDINENQITSITEKPTESYMVNAGIYVLAPSVFQEIEDNGYLDMTRLFERLIKKGKKTIVFPIREYWLDIGKMDDFEQAQIDYNAFWRGIENE